MWLHLPFPSLSTMFCFLFFALPIRTDSADPRAAHSVFMPWTAVVWQSCWRKACTSFFDKVSASWEIFCRSLREVRATTQIYMPFMHNILSLEFATR